MSKSGGRELSLSYSLSYVSVINRIVLPHFTCLPVHNNYTMYNVCRTHKTQHHARHVRDNI